MATSDSGRGVKLGSTPSGTTTTRSGSTGSSLSTSARVWCDGVTMRSAALAAGASARPISASRRAGCHSGNSSIVTSWMVSTVGTPRTRNGKTLLVA